MHSSNGALLRIPGCVALNKRLSQTMIAKLPGAESSSKKPTVVLMGLRFDDKGAFQQQLRESHLFGFQDEPVAASLVEFSKTIDASRLAMHLGSCLLTLRR